MTKEDRNLLRAMFLILFSMLWNISSLLLNTEVTPDVWAGLLKKATEVSKKEE